MKHFAPKLAAALSALAVFAAAPAGAQAGELDDIKAAGVIKVATEGTFSPYTFHNEKDQLVGMDVDFARALAAKLGVKAQFVETAWDGIIAGLDAKRYDVIINQVFITPERAAKYDFSVPYVYNYGAAIVRSDNTTIKSFEDIRGKKAAQSLSSSWNKLAKQYGAEILGVSEMAQSLQLVLSGRADVSLNSEIALANFKREHPNAPLKVVAKSSEVYTAAVMMRKGSDDLKAAVDKAIGELQADGTLKALSLKYLNVDVTHK